VPAPRDESTQDFATLQKQLILAQVRILELEDLRDELQAAIQHRSKVFADLQVIADRSLLDAEHSYRTLDQERAEKAALKNRLETLQRSEADAARHLAACRDELTQAQTAAAAHASRIEILDRELRSVKASRSWRWSAPLRFVERLWR
jgi:hypothetical protein